MAGRFRTPRWRRGMARRKTSKPGNRRSTIEPNVMGQPVWENIRKKWKVICVAEKYPHIELGGKKIEVIIRLEFGVWSFGFRV
jgi:hypothetical protein